MAKCSRRGFMRAAAGVTAVGAAVPMTADATPPPIPPEPELELCRGPYLQAQTPTRMTLRWRTSPGVPATLLRFGDAPGNLKYSAAASASPSPTRRHRDWTVTLTGLEPNRCYYYAVEAAGAILAGADDAHHFRTAPPAGEPSPFRFWVLGDCGTNRLGSGNPGRAVAARNGFRRFNTKPLDGMLLLGDNAYSHGTDAQYQTALFAVYREELAHTPLWPCIGNHEMSDDYFRIFTVPSAGEAGGVASGSPNYYSFDHANVHFVVLDLFKAAWRTAAARQRQWLERDLAATRQDWVVAVNHFPPYCKGKYDSDRIPYLADVRQRILPTLEAHGVDVFLCGHDHTYQRSYLLDGHHGPGSTFAAARHCKAEGDGGRTPWVKRHGPHQGLVVVVTGTAGAEDSLRSPDPRGGRLDHPALLRFPKGDQGGHGFRQLGTFLLEVDGLSLCGSQINDRGVVIDRFTLEKRR